MSNLIKNFIMYNNSGIYLLTTGPLGPRLMWDRSGVGPMGPIKPLGPGGPGSPNSPVSPGGPSGPGSPKIIKTDIKKLKKVKHRTDYVFTE